jgi:hypothetical protein
MIFSAIFAISAVNYYQKTNRKNPGTIVPTYGAGENAKGKDKDVMFSNVACEKFKFIS